MNEIQLETDLLGFSERFFFFYLVDFSVKITIVKEQGIFKKKYLVIVVYNKRLGLCACYLVTL